MPDTAFSQTEVDELSSVEYAVLTRRQIINEFIEGHTSDRAAPHLTKEDPCSGAKNPHPGAGFSRQNGGF